MNDIKEFMEGKFSFVYPHDGSFLTIQGDGGLFIFLFENLFDVLRYVVAKSDYHGIPRKVDAGLIARMFKEGKCEKDGFIGIAYITKGDNVRIIRFRPE